MSFPAYPEYKDSGVPWLGEVPADWRVVPLKQACELLAGQSPSSDDCNQNGAGQPFLQGCAEFGSLHPLPRQFCEVSPKVCLAGDVLLSVRAPVGTLNVADQPYGIGRGLCAIRATKLESRFLWHVLTASKGYLTSIATGSTYVAVSTEQVASIRVALPSPKEQAAISSFLDRETSKIDALVAEQERLIALLKEKRQAVISQAVTKGLNPHAPMKDSGIEWLGEIPAHWEVVKIVRLFRASKGKEGQLLTKEYCAENAGEYPVYSGQTENAGVMGTLDRYEFDAGDQGYLFSTTVGAKAMTVNHIFGKFSLSQNCMIIRPSDEAADPRFFYYHFQPVFGYHRSLIPDHMQPSFRMEDLYSFAVALPPKDEQFKIAGFLDRTLDGYETLTNEAQAAITLLQERRAALISAAVTGKIDVRRLVDAPATAELETV